MSVTSTILNSTGSVSSAISGVSSLANATGSYAKKIKSLVKKGKSPATIRDIITNGFLSTNSIFKPQFFARTFDEPTYLTFRIEFINEANDMSNAKRNISYNNTGAFDSSFSSYFYNTMYDYMPEPFLDGYTVTSTSQSTGMSSKDASLGKRYSTEAYLDMNLGDHGRAAMLHTFKLALDDIQKVFPFYFKSVTGLSSLSKVDSKRGSRLKDAKITIECEEGLDLKITQLLNLYRKIVWDDTYQRWVLPDMMRYFGMRIYISEIRTFHDRKVEGKKSDNYIYDFSLEDSRNATTTPSKENGWNKALGIAQQATTLTNAFLGTKSVITQAVNYAQQAMTAADDVIGAVNAIAQDIGMCNNAINTVLPTICYECHMCEFDIEDMMSYLDQLQSSNANISSPNPKISIKIGQIQESQVYPLNSSLRSGQMDVTDGSGKSSTTNGYYNTVSKQGTDSSYGNIDGFTSIVNQRDQDNGMKFLGNYLYDEALNRKYTTHKLGDRLQQYTENLSHIAGDAEAAIINEKRLYNEQVINNIYDMTYNEDSLDQETAIASLTTAALNEATDLTRRLGVNSSIVGTNSLATDQTESVKNAMQSVGDALQEAAERIYTNPDIVSMATSEEQKAKIAQSTFESFIEELDNSTATQNTALKAILRQYKTLSEPLSDNLSTATSKTKIDGFSGLN